MADQLSHIDAGGNAVMVDISAKADTTRIAIAKARVLMSAQTAQLIADRGHKKGDVLGIAQLAGIMGAKKTPDLIPLCHPLPLTSVTVDLELADDVDGVDITATCKTTGKTGVEMEALTAASVAALTVFDMCKAVDKAMQITDIRVTHKEGGKSGTYTAD
ncbi:MULTISPECIES: cyclic pyranopterin monophosphate synthase MoaC [Thalassospira]|uniref:Cyclic pyranopterin monophosphate synthase n=2 Tax=Thalassospira TaxID=168934 RepID=A0A367W736_9PROT|nr:MULTISPECIES: cyclic pyranopterin monophosphate synthase MoaC [Thalassospira]MDG4719575.1 cyclic pyranopterin monophosphate synthase MoaC [Thalassospira sp. FZY0004]RCK36382.1 molybdenum cofactor biosynthesis protein MoaC [Thalassospira profundimaris]